jgi:hypothetical protein
LRRGVSQLSHGALRLIDGRIGVGLGGGVSVGDGNVPMRPAGDFALGHTAGQPEFVPKRVVFVSISVRSAIYGYCGDVAGGIEAPRAQRPGELFANLAFDRLKLSGE